MPGGMEWADEWIQSMSCDLCRQRPSKKPTYEKGDLFSSWLRDNATDTPNKTNAGMKQSPPPRQDAKDEPVVAVVMHAFTAVDPRPFPPDVYGDMSILPGQSLFVYPGKTQSGWCFAESTRNGAEKGWVPGNYISRDGVNPFVELDDVAWKEVDPGQLQSQAGNGPTAAATQQAASQAAMPQAQTPQQTLQAQTQAGSFSQPTGDGQRGYSQASPAKFAAPAAASAQEYGTPPEQVYAATAPQRAGDQVYAGNGTNRTPSDAESVLNPPVAGQGRRRSTYMEALI